MPLHSGQKCLLLPYGDLWGRPNLLEKNMHNDLPDMPEPKPITPLHERNVNLDKTIHVSPLYGFVDSDWVSNSQHRRSISGITWWLERLSSTTKFQQNVAMSSIEAEFDAAWGWKIRAVLAIPPQLPGWTTTTCNNPLRRQRWRVPHGRCRTANPMHASYWH